MDSIKAAHARARRKMIIAQKSKSKHVGLPCEDPNDKIETPDIQQTPCVNRHRSHLSQLSTDENLSLENQSMTESFNQVNGIECANSQVIRRTNITQNGRGKKKVAIDEYSQENQSVIDDVNDNNFIPILYCQSSMPTNGTTRQATIKSSEIQPTSSPLSNVINPTCSRVCKKRRVKSIGSARLTFTDDVEENIHSLNIYRYGVFMPETMSHFESELYEKAESQLNLDLGDPSYICDKCHAHMWFEERPDKKKMTVKGDFFSLLCEGKGLFSN